MPSTTPHRPADDASTTAVVTGASSGLGAEFARQLSARGTDLILVARREERLVSLANELRSPRCRVDVIVQDLSASGAGETLHHEIRSLGRPVRLLINNAGSGTLGDVVDTSVADLDAQIQLNVTSVTTLSRLFSADFVSAGAGTVVNIASLAALLPAPHMAVYGATKAYVHSFTEALSVELSGTGAHAVVVDPGPTRTEFFDASGGRIGPDSAFATVEQVVAATLRALDRRRVPRVVVPGRGNAFSAPILSRLPRGLGLTLSERLNRLGLEIAARERDARPRTD